MLRTLGILILAAMTVQAQQAVQQAPFDRFGRFVGLTAEIDALAAKLTELRQQYKDSHPEVRALQERLDGLRAQLSAERDRAPQADASDALQKAARAQLEAMRASLAAQSARLAELNSRANPGVSSRLPDNWWRNASVVSALRLTPAQVKQIEETFQRNRLRLIDLNAALEKEEATLEPLVAADRLDEGKATAQIDRLAQARAELEKSRGRMLIGFRKVLDPEQWRRLSDMGLVFEKPPIR